VAVTLALGLGVGLAWASIGSSGSGKGSGSVGTFTAAVISAPSLKGGASPYPTITWTNAATTVAAGYESTVNYVVERCSTTTSTPCTPTTPVASGACHGTLIHTTTSCVDTSAVANADDTYRVVAVYRSGSLKKTSNTVTTLVDTTPPVSSTFEVVSETGGVRYSTAPPTSAAGTVYFNPTVAGSITLEYTVTEPAISSTLAGSGPAKAHFPGMPEWGAAATTDTTPLSCSTTNEAKSCIYEHTYSYAVGATTPGVHTAFEGTDVAGNTAAASATTTWPKDTPPYKAVSPRLTLTPTSGTAGTVVTVTGLDLVPTSLLTFKFTDATHVTTTLTPTCTPAETTASGALPSGAGVCKITIPSSAAHGTGTVTVTTALGYTVSANFPVNKVATKTVVSGNGTSVSGQSVTFTAKVTNTGSGAGSATGHVAFYEKANGGSTAPIPGCTMESLSGTPDVATCTTTGLMHSGSTYTISAVYAGDTHHKSSTSAGVTQTVNIATTSFAIKVTGGSSVTITHGAQATLSETGLPAGGTGTLRFKTSGTVTLCSVALTAATHCLTATTLAAGTYLHVKASYSGTTNYKSSTASNTVTLKVVAANGSGSMTVSPSSATATSKGNTYTFKYTAAAGGLVNGTITIAVPTTWTTPQTTSSTSAGYTTESGGGGTVTYTATNHLIKVTGVTLSGGTTLTITYGGGTNATKVTVPSTTGTATFTTKEASLSGGTPAAITTQPKVGVYAKNGLGTMSVSPTAVSKSSATTLTFTFKAATGGMSTGEVTVKVPATWPAPKSSSATSGYTKASTGSLTITSGTTRTIKVTGVTLSSGTTMTITYGATSKTVTSPATAGTYTFTAKEASISGGTLTALSSSPTVLVGSSGTLYLYTTHGIEGSKVEFNAQGLTKNTTATATFGGQAVTLSGTKKTTKTGFLGGVTPATNHTGTNVPSFIVPTGIPAGTYRVLVKAGSGFATETYTVNVSTPSPTSGSPGQTVTMTVAGLVASHALTVTFGGMSVTLTSGTTTNGSGAGTFTFAVPQAADGAYSISVSDGTSTYTLPAANGFTVTGSSGPSLTSLSKSSGSVTTSVTVKGSGFAASKSITVTVGVTSATITGGGTSTSGGTVTTTFKIPFSGNGTYPIYVSTATHTHIAKYTSTFKVTGSFQGLMWNKYTDSKGGGSGANISCGTVSSYTDCALQGLGAGGHFYGAVALVKTGAAAPAAGATVAATKRVDNSGSSSIAVSAVVVFAVSPGGSIGTTTTGTITHATYTTSTATAGEFKMTLANVGGDQATMIATLMVNGVLYNLAYSGK
jgi:hypothetical protein